MMMSGTRHAKKQRMTVALSGEVGLCVLPLSSPAGRLGNSMRPASQGLLNVCPGGRLRHEDAWQTLAAAGPAGCHGFLEAAQEW